MTRLVIRNFELWTEQFNVGPAGTVDEFSTCITETGDGFCVTLRRRTVLEYLVCSTAQGGPRRDRSEY